MSDDDPNEPNGPRPTDVPCEGGGLAVATSRNAVRLLNFQGASVGDRGAISRALAALQDAPMTREQLAAFLDRAGLTD